MLLIMFQWTSCHPQSCLIINFLEKAWEWEWTWMHFWARIFLAMASRYPHGVHISPSQSSLPWASSPSRTFSMAENYHSEKKMTKKNWWWSGRWGRKFTQRCRSCRIEILWGFWGPIWYLKTMEINEKCNLWAKTLNVLIRYIRTWQQPKIENLC